jgi:hypothetical protein
MQSTAVPQKICQISKIFEKTVTNQNCIHEEIKSRLNSGNACYHGVQNLSSRLLSRIVRLKMYKTRILSVALYRCESWSFTLKEEHR